MTEHAEVKREHRAIAMEIVDTNRSCDFHPEARYFFLEKGELLRRGLGIWDDIARASQIVADRDARIAQEAEKRGMERAVAKARSMLAEHAKKFRADTCRYHQGVADGLASGASYLLDVDVLERGGQASEAPVTADAEPNDREQELAQKVCDAINRYFRRQKIPKRLRQEVFLAAGGKCHYCGERAFTIDHKVPISSGGTDRRDNLVLACQRCNSIKGSTPYEEFKGMAEAIERHGAEKAAERKKDRP